MKLPKIRCKYIYDFKTNELYWVCQNCYTQILDNKKDEIIICPKCKNIVKEKKNV